EEGHEAAATTPLRVQVRDAGHRHVVGEVEGAVPGLIAIQRSRAEPQGAEFAAVLIDALRQAEEDLAAFKEPTVVIEVVDVDLEPAVAHLGEERIRNRISVLRND